MPNQEPAQFTDKHFICSDCEETFTWSAGEQRYYLSKGLTSEPRRCKPCRDARKAAQAYHEH